MTRAQCLFAAGLLSLTCSAHANLISNGSFEFPLVPPGTFTSYPSGSLFGPWTTVGAGEVALVHTSFAASGLSFPAQEGNNWLDLTHGFNGANGVEQTIPTVIGGLYQITFYLGNIVNPGGPFGTSSSVSISTNGFAGNTATVDGSNSPPTTTLAWTQFNALFLADSAQTTVRFTNLDGPSDNSNGLDNISIVEVSRPTPSVVPVPATLPLLASGMALLGLLGRKRARRG
ncbi:MAG: DUF642 domain-containing protein [Proteobacteria bacterium]|nr:DUF642 domain-containing protein [Burkholderiales bacterium]